MLLPATQKIGSIALWLPSKPGIRQLVPGEFNIIGIVREFEPPVSRHARALMRLTCGIDFPILFYCRRIR